MCPARQKERDGPLESQRRRRSLVEWLVRVTGTELKMLCHPSCRPGFSATPFDRRLSSWSGPYRLAKEPTASRRIHADCIAYIELDIEEAVDVRRPLGGTWMGATWGRNTHCISKKSPTMRTGNFTDGDNRKTATNS
jgi:hypothetical protein